MSDRIELGAAWAAIPHEVLRDARLTAAAKGGLVTLLSHKEGWVRSVIAVLMAQNRCGRKAARNIMRELVDTGYAQMTQQRGDDGRFTTAYTVYAKAQLSPDEVASPPGAVERGAVERGAVQGSVEEEALELEALEVESQSLEPTTLGPLRIEQAGFAEFYATFPYRRARLAAEKAYRAACKLTTPEILLSAAERFRDDPNLPTDASKVPYPASWLNAGRWDDDPLPERNGHRPSQHPIDRRVAEIMARRNGDG